MQLGRLVAAWFCSSVYPIKSNLNCLGRLAWASDLLWPLAFGFETFLINQKWGRKNYVWIQSIEDCLSMDW